MTKQLKCPNCKRTAIKEDCVRMSFCSCGELMEDVTPAQHIIEETKAQDGFRGAFFQEVYKK